MSMQSGQCSPSSQNNRRKSKTIYSNRMDKGSIKREKWNENLLPLVSYGVFFLLVVCSLLWSISLVTVAEADWQPVAVVLPTFALALLCLSLLVFISSLRCSLIRNVKEHCVLCSGQHDDDDIRMPLFPPAQTSGLSRWYTRLVCMNKQELTPTNMHTVMHETKE